MAVEYQLASVSLGQGIDTKTDKKLVQGKMIDLQNGVFTAGGEVTKRNGNDQLSSNIIAGGSLTNVVMSKSYGERLIAASSGRLYDYSKSLSAWRDCGAYDSISVANTLVSGGNRTERNATTAIYGNYALTVYDLYFDVTDTTKDIRSCYSVIDLTTGSALASDTYVATTTNPSRGGRAVLLGGSQLAVVYLNGDTGRLAIKLVSISASGASLGADVNIANDIQFYSPIFVTGTLANLSYDVVQTTTGATLAYSSNASGNPINFVNLAMDGTTSGTGAIASAGFAYPISLTRDTTNGNIWAYYGSVGSSTAPNGTTGVKYAIMSSALASVLAPKTIAASIPGLRQITSLITNITTQQVYYSVFGALPTGVSAPVTSAAPLIYTATVQSNGTTSVTSVYLRNYDIYGKPFAMSGKNYLPVVYPSQTQFSGFLIDLTDGHVAAKFLRNAAEAAYSAEMNISLYGGGYWWRLPGSLALANQYGTSKIIFSAGKVIANNIQNTYPGSTNISDFIMGTCLVTLDWNDPDANMSTEAENVLVLNGSVPTIYDGSHTSELGFHNSPEVICSSIATSGGSLAVGTYGVTAIYEWADSQGNLYQSEDSNLINVVIGTANSTMTLNVKTCTLTSKDSTITPIAIKIYATAVGGTIPYLISTVTNNSSFSYATVVWDGTGQDKAQPVYTNGGAIVSNSAPPSAMVMWQNYGRLWLVDSENPQTDAWYSKTFSGLNGIAFSSSLTYTADQRFGKIKAGSAMDEKTVLLKEGGLLYFIGDGASDAGSSSSLTFSQIIPSDVGCAGSKGVVLIPGGIVFWANNKKGMYLISRGLQVQYFGSDIEKYNSQDIQSALIVGNTTQVRFLSKTGTTLVFDYYYNQWGTFTNYQGVSATIWNGVYTYARADGLLFTENNTTFRDATTAYALSVTLHWLKAAAIQNFQRVRMVSLLGDYSGGSGHGVQISAAYDYGTAFQTTVPYLFPSTGGTYQCRAFLPQQKCEALQLLIQEITTGALGESVSFSDLGLEIGLKKGANKLSASQSVG